MYHLCYFCLVLLRIHARLFVNTLWSSAGKGLTSWLSFMMFNRDVVTFPLVSRDWVDHQVCGFAKFMIPIALFKKFLS